MANYPSIPSPTTDVQSLQDSVLALKQAFEILSGQKGVTAVAAATNASVATSIAATNASIATSIATAALALPVSVANGGTADSGTAWTSYTPTLSATAGTFTTIAANIRYKTIGKTVFMSGVIALTTPGAATGYINFTLPINNNGTVQGFLIGREMAANGKTFICSPNGVTKMQAIYYDNGVTASVAGTYEFSGVYEAA